MNEQNSGFDRLILRQVHTSTGSYFDRLSMTGKGSGSIVSMTGSGSGTASQYNKNSCFPERIEL
jgi:hypothetical protein